MRKLNIFPNTHDMDREVLGNGAEYSNIIVVFLYPYPNCYRHENIGHHLYRAIQ